MKIEDLERVLVGTLRLELASIASYIGQEGEFIYVDYPRLDARMPRISLSLTSSVETPIGIGAEIESSSNLGVLETTIFDIDIWVHRENKTTSTPVRGGTSLRDYLGDEVVSILLQKRGDFQRIHGILDIEKTGESIQPYDEDNELFRKTITITVTHVRQYTG